MRELIKKIDALIEKAMAETGDKKEKLLGKAGVDPAHVRKYRRNNWIYSDTLLEGFANIPGFPDLNTLKSWRLREEYDDDVIKLALIEGLKLQPQRTAAVKKAHGIASSRCSA